MVEKRYCIICGMEIFSDDPDVILCPKHGGLDQSEPQTPQPQETTWEAEEEAAQPLTDITGKWQKGQTLLDTYEVVGKLGEGGMGLVYRVHHKSWNMDLAVKQSKASLFSTQKGKEGFIREAETWVNLGLHPHITSCYYVRTIEDIPHIFVEYMAGGSLEDWIQGKGHDLYAGSKQESLERILDIAIQFAWGLAYAHECNLVHQDVKPLNVLMSPEGIVKVTDFGLAKARAKAGEATGEKDRRALVSGSLHTRAYRSPEQAKGEMLSPKTDIWSWAVSVLEMFEGGVYWYDGQSAGTSLESYLVREGDGDQPSMPEGLIELLRECFQEDPVTRPEDMLEIALRLTEIYESKIGEPYSRQKPEPAELKADSQNNKALTMLDLGGIEQAEVLLEQVVAENSQHVAATYNLGLLRWRSGRIIDLDVLQTLEQIQRVQPEDGRATSALGWVCLESGRYGESLAYFEQAVRLGDDSDSEHGLALIRPLAESGISACLRTFKGHKNNVKSVAFSPDGCQVLSGSIDKTLKLWDLATGRCLRTFEGHTAWVNSVAITPDGRQAISGSSDKTLKLWDLATGRCLCTFEGHKSTLDSVAISPDGRYALSGSSDKTLKLWDLATGRCLRTFKGHDGYVHSVAFSPDGHRALSGSFDKTLKLWDTTKRRCLRTFEGHEDSVRSVAFSPDGRQALSGSRDHTLKLWDLGTGRCLRTFEKTSFEATKDTLFNIHSSIVVSVAFSPDGCKILSGSNDKTLKLWDAATGRCLRTFEGFTKTVESVAFSPDGRHALSGSDDKTQLWDLTWLEENHYTAPLRYARGIAGSEAVRRERTHAAHLQRVRKLLENGQITAALACLKQARCVPGFERDRETLEMRARVGARARIKGLNGGWLTHTFEGHSRSVYSIAFTPDGRQAISGSGDNTLKLWDLATGECLRTFEGHTQDVRSVAISPNGREILSGSSWDHTLKLWDLAKGECLRTFEKHKNWVYSVAFSPDGYQALSGSWDHTLKLWNPATELCMRTFSGHTNGVWSIAFTPDGRQALSGSIDKTLKLWDLAKGECLRTFEEQPSEVLSVAISPDGREILCGSRNMTLKLWDLTTGSCLRTFEGHVDEVLSVAFSPTGCQALSGSKDKTLKLWDLATGRCLHTFEGHEDSVRSVAFSPDGCQVLSGSEDHTLKLWDLDWEYEFPGWGDWDEGARRYLETFLTLHIPHVKGFRRAREITHSSKSTWTEVDFQQLLNELGTRGYGWLQPEGIRQKLGEMAKERG